MKISRLSRRRLFGAVLSEMATAPMSPATAAAASEDDLAALLEPIHKQFNLPALAATVLVAGQTSALGAVGVRKYGTLVPVTKNDQFHLGSCTKAMTATLCGFLIESGHLHWDTRLAQVFPDIPMRPEYRVVTLDHLLAHRSGFSANSWPQGKTFLKMFALPGSPRQQRTQYLQMILQENPVAAPGAEFLYSNRNYVIVGAMLERITDVAWEDLIRQKLFTPLGMTSAGFGAMGTPGRIDQPWPHKLFGPVHWAIGPGPRSDNPPVIAPAGTIHCAIGDWAKFVALHLQGEQGTSKLLTPETLQRLHSPQFGGNYAGGWLVTERPWGGGDGKVLTHAGSNTQNFAVVWIAPRKDFAALAVTNQGGMAAAQATDQVAEALIQHFA
jgi:CubicO group peptidase (beta-lactamase class C family)